MHFFCYSCVWTSALIQTISQIASLEEKVSRYKMNVLHYRACILFLLSKQFCLDGLFRNYNWPIFSDVIKWKTPLKYAQKAQNLNKNLFFLFLFYFQLKSTFTVQVNSLFLVPALMWSICPINLFFYLF